MWRLYILTLAAYERARRALRGECELHSAKQSEVRIGHSYPKRKDSPCGCAWRLYILALAAYEQARRALRGECELHSAKQSEVRIGHSYQKEKTALAAVRGDCIFSRLPLTSELDALCAENANSILRSRVKCVSDTATKKEKTALVAVFSFWSKCGDSNSRPPVPELKFIRFLILLFTYSPYIPRKRLILHVCSVVSV